MIYGYFWFMVYGPTLFAGVDQRNIRLVLLFASLQFQVPRFDVSLPQALIIRLMNETFIVARSHVHSGTFRLFDISSIPQDHRE